MTTTTTTIVLNPINRLLMVFCMFRRLQELADESVIVESIRKGVTQSSVTLAERFSNLKPSIESVSKGSRVKKIKLPVIEKTSLTSLLIGKLR